MKKKFKLIEYYSMHYNGRDLYKIEALRDFGNIKKGDIGGWVEEEENLSHEGNCWISDDAKVYSNAKVSGNAHVYGLAEIHDNSDIYGNAIVGGHTEISGAVDICDKVFACDHAKIFENARVSGNTQIYGNAKICGDVSIHGNSEIYGDAEVCGGGYEIYNLKFGKDASITGSASFIHVGPLGSRNDYTTFYRSKSGGIIVRCGCFNNTIEKFEEAVRETHKANELYLNQYMDTIEFAKKRLLF